MTRLIKSKSEMHNTWWIVPVGNIGQIKAKATAKKRSCTITIDGIPSKFHAIAYKYIDEKRTCWGVMIVMMMTKQPKPRKKKAIEREPPIPQPNIKQQSQPLFDNEEQLGHIYR